MNHLPRPYSFDDDEQISTHATKHEHARGSLFSITNEYLLLRTFWVSLLQQGTKKNWMASIKSKCNEMLQSSIMECIQNTPQSMNMKEDLYSASQLDVSLKVFCVRLMHQGTKIKLMVWIKWKKCNKMLQSSISGCSQSASASTFFIYFLVRVPPPLLTIDGHKDWTDAMMSY